MIRPIFFVFTFAFAFTASGQLLTVNPQVKSIVSQVSPDHIADTQKKLESFGTRNIYSSTTDPEHGIGAAREWIAAQFRSYSPKLQVSFDKHRLKGNPADRLYKDVEIWNVVAMLPGTSEPEQQIIIGGHYDSIHMISKEGPNGRRGLDAEATIAAVAPGVTDDGSGTATVMELARVMSQFQFRKTIIFIAFASEEYGLEGSSTYADAAAAKHDQIEAMFNNDIVGSNVTGNGETTNRYVNVYSEDPEDSPSREVARYMQEINERYQPGFNVHLVFRPDRFGRGGDHSPFNANGFAAVRVTTPMENYANQHTATDTFANTAPEYTVLVARADAAAMASLALAPKAPELGASRNSAAAGGRRVFGGGLSRGSGYDAVMTWHDDHPEADLMGYAVVMRKTTSPDWEREIFVGNATTYTLPRVNIDEVVLGVKAIDKDGNESLVSPYVMSPYRTRKVETY
jgi:hypothetical protein